MRSLPSPMVGVAGAPHLIYGESLGTAGDLSRQSLEQATLSGLPTITR